MSRFQPNPKGKGGDEKGKGRERKSRELEASVQRSEGYQGHGVLQLQQKGAFCPRLLGIEKRDKDAKDHPDGGKAKGKQSPSLRVARKITPKEKEKARLLLR